MTWSYSGDPAESDKDFVRYKIGDIDTNDQLISDEEITFELGQTDAPLSAAYNATQAILRKLARRVSKKIGPASVELQQQFTHYKEVERMISKELSEKGMAVPVQGDLHSPIFTVGMMNND